MWDQTFKRWLDLVFWWLPKPQAAEQPSAQAPEPAPETAPAPRAAEPTTPKPAPRVAEPAAARTPEPAAPEAKEPPARAATKQAAPERPAASDRAPDDLTVIKGIGPVVQQKLHALGIRTFDDLAAADPETLAGQLKGRQPISQALVRGWTEAADQRTAARH
jgi:predicted flap endonuclease-1-like 5' DNA nuclease